jgi:septal ring factor EnvC (AmiA/AmiB activator)
MADTTSPVSGPQSAPRDRHDTHSGSPFAIRATVFILAIAAIVLAYVAYHEKSQLSDTTNQLTQSNTDLTQAKTDVDSGKAQLAALQTKLSAAGAQVSDLQKQLADAQGQGTDFQSKLAKAQAAQADLRSQLDAAKTQSASLQSELSRANDGMADVHKQLDQANARATDLQAQIDKAKSDAANPQPAPVATRALPVAATFEKGFWGDKYTMHVKNQGTDPLPINVTVAGGAVKSATVQGGATYDLKDLPAGSSVVISSDGFETANLTVK